MPMENNGKDTEAKPSSETNGAPSPPANSNAKSNESNAETLEKDIKRGEWWLIRIGIATALINTVIAVIYWGQLQEMRKATLAATQASQTAKDTLTEMRMGSGAQDTHTLAQQAVAQAQQTAALANAAGTQAKATTSAAMTAKDALEVENRPWIVATVTQNGPLQFGPYGAGIEVQFHLKNVGHTPSIDTRYHASIVSLPQKTWVAVEIRDAEKRECDSFPQYFFAGSPQFLPAIFPNEEPPPAPWPASINPKGLQDAIASESQGRLRHDGFVSLYLVSCVVYRAPYSPELHRSAYGFDLGIPKGPGIWMSDLKPEGSQPDVRLIFMDSFAD